MDLFNKKKVAQLEQENHELRAHSLFNLSDSEYQDIRKFTAKHYKKHKKDGFKGNKYIYTITGCGIGCCIAIKCPICGEEEDITDISNW